MSLVTSSTDATFIQDTSTGLVLVDFWAEWCGPCKVMLPRLDELSLKVEGKAKIMKVDVDSNGDSAMKFNVMSIPTLILFKDGKMVEKAVGTKEIPELEAMIAKHL